MKQCEHSLRYKRAFKNAVYTYKHWRAVVDSGSAEVVAKAEAKVKSAGEGRRKMEKNLAKVNQRILCPR
jgi:hypothetical protein